MFSFIKKLYRNIICGIHSGFPICCVLSYITIDNIPFINKYIRKNIKGEHFNRAPCLFCLWFKIKRDFTPYPCLCRTRDYIKHGKKSLYKSTHVFYDIEIYYMGDRPYQFLVNMDESYYLWRIDKEKIVCVPNNSWINKDLMSGLMVELDRLYDNYNIGDY